MMDFEKELCLFEMMVNGLIAGVSGGAPSLACWMGYTLHQLAILKCRLVEKVKRFLLLDIVSLFGTVLPTCFFLSSP